MPELPEVETTRRGLLDAMTGQSIVDVRVHDGRLRWPVEPDMPARLSGARVERLERRAKYLLVRTDRGTLIIHLGMSGSLRVAPASLPLRLHDHVELLLGDERGRAEPGDAASRAEHRERGVRQRRHEWVAGTGEVLVADDHERAARGAGKFIEGERLPGSAHDGGESRGVVPRLVCVLGEQQGVGVGVVGVAIDRRGDAFASPVVGPQHVLADTCQHQSAEPVWLLSGDAQQGHCPQREAHRIDGFVGQVLDDACSEVGVRLGFVGFRCLAMTEQVDADHRTAEVGDEFGEAAALPCGGERAAPAVHEYDRRSHEPTVALVGPL